MENNDHRHIGQQLRLFHFQEEAPGMVFWHPRGLIVYRMLEDAVRRRADADGFQEVRTPQLLRQPIWESSGHWQHFRQNMFLVESDERLSAMKPVNCPGHLQIVNRMVPSYRDLPLRVSEFGVVHRNEQSGALLGLFRLRQFTQDDGHVLCAEDQVAVEVARFCRSLREFYEAFGFKDVRVGFSTRPEERVGSDDLWDRAERALSDAAAAAGLPCVVQPGQGAFYGPKLEFVLSDRLGRDWQCGTIQLDFVMPSQFGVEYVDADGAKKVPVMLHRAMLGSMERFIGILLEHYEGALPGWLAPQQVVVVPVSTKQADYADRVVAELSAAGLRARTSLERVSRAIVDAHADGIPHVIIVGKREEESLAVSLRDRSNEQSVLPLAEAVDKLRSRCRPPV